jgi:chromosome segregation ATPase
MSGTNGTKPASIVAVLQRADSRWAKDQASDPADPDYLHHLATYLEPVAENIAEPPVDEHDLAMLREQVTAAETNAAARRAELDQARAEIDELRQQLDTAHATAEQRVADVRAELGRHADAQERRAERAERELQQRDEASQQKNEEPAKLREQAKLIRQLRADYDALVVENEKIADQLAAAQAQRDSALDHRCVWQWHGPDEPIKACTCGRTVPRYELREIN